MHGLGNVVVAVLFAASWLLRMDEQLLRPRWPDQLTGQGRPALRLAAWRAVWGAQPANPVYAARYRHLTTRQNNKLKPTQAQSVIAAAILRHLHAVITTGETWDPTVATHCELDRGDLALAPTFGRSRAS